MSITTEELKKLAGYKQAGTFKHETNPGFKGDDTSEHILRFVPYCRENPGEGVVLGLSLPVAIAWAWLDRPEDAMRGLADQLNACPDLARRVIAAEKLAEALKFIPAAVKALNGYEADYGEPLPDDREIGRIEESRNSPSFRIRVGHIRKIAAALSEWEASNG